MLFSLPVTGFILLWEVYFTHENIFSQTLNNRISLNITNLVTVHQKCYVCYSINIDFLCVLVACVAKIIHLDVTVLCYLAKQLSLYDLKPA